MGKKQIGAVSAGGFEKSLTDDDLESLRDSYGHLWRPTPRVRVKCQPVADGMTVDEVAAELRITVGEVRSIERKAIMKLRRLGGTPR